jgi:hypothetical protein
VSGLKYDNTTLRYWSVYSFAIIPALLFLLVGVGLAQAQTTKVSGKVFDADSREPLPFVNVVFKGTTVGTTTDFDGFFTITTENAKDSLVISYIGYIKKTIPVKVGASNTNLQILLKNNSQALPEIVIKPGENPAHVILGKVIKNKPINNREKADYYQYEVYNKIEFDINNINDRLKKSILMKPFTFIFDNIDSSNVEEKPSLPLFLSESLSEVYYRKSPKVTKEVIKASKVAGVDNNQSVSQFTGDLYQNVNIYDNNVLVFGKQFVSPISDNGLWYYRYYLIDSLWIGNQWCYHIQFKPKRQQELTFKGNMWINDTTFALRRLEMNMAGDANINYVNTFYVVQDYTNVDGTWMLLKDRLVVDFIIRKDKPGFYGRKTTSYRNHLLNKPLDEKFYTRTDNLVVEEQAEKRTNDFWVENRHDTLSKNEANIYKMVDTIQTLKAYKTWADIIQLALTGYRVIGKFEFGPTANIYSFNRVEGSRFRLGGRTSNAFSTHHEFSGYGAYGLLDERFKVGLGYRGFITKNPRQMVFVNYKNDLEILGQSQNAFTQDNILATLFRRNPLVNLTRVEQFSAAYSYEWFKGFENRVTLVNRKLFPLGNLRYEYRRDDNTVVSQDNIITSEVRLYARLAIDEKYIAGEFDRISTGTKYPIVAMQLNLGMKGVFNSDYNYQRISLNVNDRFRIKPLGYTDYMIEYGKIFGKVPYPLMELHGGNETYYFDPYAFNMMNYFEFASDQYFSVSMFHHFDGLFLNKIPLLRKLKWRETATGKILWGGVNQVNRGLLIFPEYISYLGNTPYAEAGVGLENIFKIIRIDALWRLTYLDKPNIAKFGIRGSLQFIF